MSPGQVAAMIAAIAFAMLVVGALFLMGSAMRTLKTTRVAVEDLRRTSVPLLNDVHTAVRQANGDLIHVERVLESAQSISGTMDSASRLALAAFSNPMVKLAAWFAGTSKALRRLRKAA
ncbi:MAG TPA: DUF948 domain-containing protein [Acidimicrobiales bacterium]|nr:DUF948 domain-containing protein [Acidimicrobiales bacterium]